MSVAMIFDFVCVVLADAFLTRVNLGMAIQVGLLRHGIEVAALSVFLAMFWRVMTGWGW